MPESVWGPVTRKQTRNGIRCSKRSVVILPQLSGRSVLLIDRLDKVSVGVSQGPNEDYVTDLLWRRARRADPTSIN